MVEFNPQPICGVGGSEVKNELFSLFFGTNFKIEFKYFAMDECGGSMDVSAKEWIIVYYFFLDDL